MACPGAAFFQNQPRGFVLPAENSATVHESEISLYHGDPLETVTHGTGVVIDGKVVSEAKR